LKAEPDYVADNHSDNTQGISPRHIFK